VVILVVLVLAWFGFHAWYVAAWHRWLPNWLPSEALRASETQDLSWGVSS
jgi:hypothetical protein